MAKVRINFAPKRLNWYDKEPEGTMKENQEAFEIAQNYMYKILDYADKDEPIPKEVVDHEKRIFSFCKQGPKAGHYLHSPRGKLVSADVLYILTSSLPSKQIGDKFKIDPRKVREIRSGDAEEWYYEYLLVRRLTSIIKGRLKQVGKITNKRGSIYSLSKLEDGKGTYNILYYTTSIRKAKELRKGCIGIKKYEELVKKDILDIIYPINEIDVLG